ncbi:hypothetical protein QTP70_026587 [Hemibagrus guttatus]|uniref:Uncharacterized protein n=1 Tax=Hemibagrus guttatus TaxID=175788 RepID=A0AAE0VFS5_9TELE|nr:hypothetical protein QTP70_026587 [Hemibagrus guttatus]
MSTAYPITGSLCPSQASSGNKAGYTLDGVPTHRRAHTRSRTTDNLEMPINLQCMSLDRGEETGVPGENPRGMGRTCKLHTWRRRESNPNPGGVRQMC